MRQTLVTCRKKDDSGTKGQRQSRLRPCHHCRKHPDKYRVPVHGSRSTQIINLLRLEGEAITAKGKTMTTEQLWQEPFHERKAKGQNSERLFMMHIACMGGAAQSLGTVPGHSDPTPRFCRPSSMAEEGFHYSVSPDIVFTLPGQPRGFASLAQVKLKKIYSEQSKGWLFVYLDEPEMYRMKIASQFFDVFFVIHTPEIADVDGFGEWLWVKFDDLSSTELYRRRMPNGKKAFVLPLNLFRPLSELVKESLHEPANIDAPPADRCVRKNDDTRGDGNMPEPSGTGATPGTASDDAVPPPAET